MAGTILASVKQVKNMTEVSLLCSCEAGAATFTSVVLNTLAGVPELLGLYLYLVKVFPGPTAPTDATDLTITDSDGVDLLGGRGTDLIDASSKTSCCVGTVYTDMPMPITGPITINISNNAVNGAVITMKLLFVE